MYKEVLGLYKYNFEYIKCHDLLLSLKELLNYHAALNADQLFFVLRTVVLLQGILDQ